MRQIFEERRKGHRPLWSPDGAEPFFASRPGCSTACRTRQHGAELHRGKAIPVAMPFQSAPPIVERPFDISRDGQHFLGLIDAAAPSWPQGAPQIHVVLNWFEELKARVPRK